MSDGVNLEQKKLLLTKTWSEGSTKYKVRPVRHAQSGIAHRLDCPADDVRREVLGCWRRLLIQTHLRLASPKQERFDFISQATPSESNFDDIDILPDSVIAIARTTQTYLHNWTGRAWASLRMRSVLMTVIRCGVQIRRELLRKRQQYAPIDLTMP